MCKKGTDVCMIDELRDHTCDRIDMFTTCFFHDSDGSLFCYTIQHAKC